MDGDERDQPRIEIARCLEDPRIQGLREANDFLSEKIREPESLSEGEGWTGTLSTTSCHKQTEALKAIERGLIPLLFPEPLPYYRPPEFSAFTGKVKDEDSLAAMALAARLGARSEDIRSEAYKSLPLSEQAEKMALWKALFDWNVRLDVCPYVYATDLRAKTGNRPLEKEEDLGRQRAALVDIAGEGTVDVAVGVAVGMIKNPEAEFNLPLRASLEEKNFLAGSLP